MNTNIKFTSKETYLAYRSEWKVKYKAISNEIRIYKHSWKHNALKAKATAALEELKEAKQEAQRQYLAAKAAKETLVSV